MNTLSNLTPDDIQTIVRRYWTGESLPSIADSLELDRIDLFNFKNENQTLWESTQAKIKADHIQSLLRADLPEAKNPREKARVSLVMNLIRLIPKLGANSFAFRDFIVEHLSRPTHHSKIITDAEIESISDAKAAVDCFEQTQGILIPESPNPKNGVYLR